MLKTSNNNNCKNQIMNGTPKQMSKRPVVRYYIRSLLAVSWVLCCCFEFGVWRLAKISNIYICSINFMQRISGKIKLKSMSGGKHLKKGSLKPELPDDGILRLFSMRFCPFAHRAHLVLAAKNIPYQAIYIDLTEKPEWLTDFSPLGKVPALLLNAEEGKPALVESLIVAEYLDEKYPENPLLPRDPLKKALDKILIDRFGAVIGSMYKVFMHGLDAEPGAITGISTGLDIYEQELRKRDTTYFGGDKPGMLDYMIWPWCERSAMLKHLIGEKYEMDQERFEHLLKWRDTMINDPAVQSHYLDGETHAKFMKSHQGQYPNYDMLVNPCKRQRTC